MNEKPTNQKRCEALKRLMVQIPEKRGLALKTASKLCHADLYKYRQESVIPLTSSLYSYGDAFQIEPCWLVMMAACIVDGHLKEEQALEILGDWPRYKSQFENVCRYAIQEAVEKCSS